MDIKILEFFLGQIAQELGLPHAPVFLTRAQIAAVVDLKNGHTLNTSASRGAASGDARWLAFRSIVDNGVHTVPSAAVARWLAVLAGMAPMPPARQPTPKQGPTRENSVFGMGSNQRPAKRPAVRGRPRGTGKFSK